MFIYLKGALQNLMMKPSEIRKIPKPDRILSYFQLEKGPLLIVMLSGIIYNIGLAAGPYFEGQLAQRLYDILHGEKKPGDMLPLSLLYLSVILIVQLFRAVKRFGVRRFANDTSRNMRHMLYNSLVHMPEAELEKENLGTIMTKAVADVDTCAEGIRKFTTEVFDTGIALLTYLVLLFYYDVRLALISCAFTPVAYLLADRLKRVVARSSQAYKESAGHLNGATMDRVANAVTYRIYGCEKVQDSRYENYLADYEKCAVTANLWENTLQPLYNVISMCGAVPIFYFGTRNVLGTGWAAWNIAAFTTFLSCFTKMAVKSSKAAKLFNSVQKAQVSWARVKPLMHDYIEAEADGRYDGNPAENTAHKSEQKPCSLCFSDVSIAWPDNPPLLRGISFTAREGEIIGITGPVASGKSSLGKVLIGELPYTGSILISGTELRSMSDAVRSRCISYMGHEPELMSDTLAENIRLGKHGNPDPDSPQMPGQHQLPPEKDSRLQDVLSQVSLDREVSEMAEKADTLIGSGGIRLSGGQQARTALARTLYNAQEILVLDDPFSAVDRRTEAEILARLRLLYHDRIILIFSHRLYRFPDFDHVLFLSDGQGTFASHAELLCSCQEYAALYEAQTAGKEENAL